MVRVLHLSSVRPDFQAKRGREFITRANNSDWHFYLRTIGRGGYWRTSAAAWIPLRYGKGDRADILHAWDEVGLIAALAVPRAGTIFSPSTLPGRRALARLKRIMRFRNIKLVFASSIERDAAVSADIEAARCHVIVPAAKHIRPRLMRNAWLRGKFGFNEQDFVLLAPGESTRSAGHLDALWAGSILHVIDARYRILFWGEGEMADACERLAEKLGQPGLVVKANSKFHGELRGMQYEALVSVADAVIFGPHGPTPLLPVMMALEAGLPIVAAPSPWIGPELTSRANWFGVDRRSPRVFAQRVLKLRSENIGRIETPADPGAVTRFVEQYEQIYRHAAGAG